jgi:hypothetical protein
MFKLHLLFLGDESYFLWGFKRIQLDEPLIYLLGLINVINKCVYKRNSQEKWLKKVFMLAIFSSIRERTTCWTKMS